MAPGPQLCPHSLVLTTRIERCVCACTLGDWDGLLPADAHRILYIESVIQNFIGHFSCVCVSVSQPANMIFTLGDKKFGHTFQI